MSRTRKFINWPFLLLAVAFVSLAGYQSLAIRNLTMIQPAVVVTVDLEGVFNQLDERNAADAELQELASELQAEGSVKAAQIDELNEELSIYTAGTDKHQEVLEKLAMASHEYRAYVEWGRRVIDARKATTLRRIYASIKASIEREAEEKGYDIVFVNDSLAAIPSGDEVETSRQISARRMLYTNPQIDITRDIIARMNREFSVAQGR